MSASTSALFTTLQGRTTTFAPTAASSSTSSFTLPVTDPFRETRATFLAPLATIHRAMLRPRPPVPPTRM